VECLPLGPLIIRWDLEQSVFDKSMVLLLGTCWGTQWELWELYEKTLGTILFKKFSSPPPPNPKEKNLFRAFSLVAWNFISKTVCYHISHGLMESMRSMGVLVWSCCVTGHEVRWIFLSCEHNKVLGFWFCFEWSSTFCMLMLEIISSLFVSGCNDCFKETCEIG
jgi:hypothetical protein